MNFSKLFANRWKSMEFFILFRWEGKGLKEGRKELRGWGDTCCKQQLRKRRSNLISPRSLPSNSPSVPGGLIRQRDEIGEKAKDCHFVHRDRGTKHKSGGGHRIEFFWRGAYLLMHMDRPFIIFRRRILPFIFSTLPSIRPPLLYLNTE